MDLLLWRSIQRHRSIQSPSLLPTPRPDLARIAADQSGARGCRLDRKADHDPHRPRRVGLRAKAMRGMPGSAAAPAARRKFRRGSFMLNPPSRFASLDHLVWGFRLIDQSVMGITDALPGLPVQLNPRNWLGGWI